MLDKALLTTDNPYTTKKIKKVKPTFRIAVSGSQDYINEKEIQKVINSIGVTNIEFVVTGVENKGAEKIVSSICSAIGVPVYRAELYKNIKNSETLRNGKIVSLFKINKILCFENEEISKSTFVYQKIAHKQDIAITLFQTKSKRKGKK